MEERTSRRALASLLAAAVAVAVVVAPVQAPKAAAAPPGFSIETLPFAGLAQPTTVEFASTGQVFVSERRGVIKTFANLDDASSTTTADLRQRVFNGGDRGLLGMALDPQYPTRPYLWALYTKDAEVGGTAPKYGTGGDSDNCGKGGANDCRVAAELTRLTLDPATGVWTGAEQVMLGGWCQQYGSHSIGTVLFGADGALYVSSGDGASYNQVDVGTLGTERCDDPSPDGGALRSLSPRRPADVPAVLNGAVLRLDPETGGPAPGNPLAGDPDPIRQRIVAYGLRNPFRMAERPGTGELWVADVGWTRFEELNRIVPGGTVENFGWPCYEGTGRQSGYDGANTPICENLYTAGAGAITAPVYAYQHGTSVGTGCTTGSSSVSAVGFASGAAAYPAAYRSKVFFGDYSRRCLWTADLTATGIDTSSIAVFDATAYPAELQAGPNGELYLVDIATSQVKRIRYSDGGNTPPIAVAQADPSNGPAPLVVQFDGSGSSDPDAGSSLGYEWDLDGDGAFDDSTSVSPSRTYTAPGTVTARLRVTDDLGASAEASVTVTVGSSAPAVTITSSAQTTPWKVGDEVTFQVSATDAEDGALPASSLDTTLSVKHCPGGANCHEHVQATFPDVASGSFVAPDHEYPSWLELRASATDSSGITTTTSLRLDPSVVNLTIDTVPSGLQAIVGADQRTTPFTVPVIERSVNTVAVPSPQTLGSTYEFTSWSDGGAISHDVTATATATLTATFRQTGGAPAIPGLVGAWSFDDGSGGTAADSSGRGAAGALEGGPAWVANGRHGGALSFDGINDRVTIPHRAHLDLTTAMTLSAWVRPSAQRTWDQAILKERPGGLAYALYATGTAGNRPNGTVSTGGADRYVDAPSGIPVGAWSHLAVTYDNANLRLYVNGTQVSSRALTGAMPVSDGPLRIGGNAIWGEWFAGQLDEVRVYNRALTAAEVVADGAAGATPDTVPPTTPTGVVATGGIASVAVSWNASTDAGAVPTYELHRSLVSGFSPAAATLVASGLASTTYTDANRPPGTYFYRVIASDGRNQSSPSAQAQAVVTGDVTAPSVPSGVGATVAGSTVTVGWSASTDDVGVVDYQVLREWPGGSTTFVTTSTSLSDAGLAGGTYEYRVRARDAAGNASAYSPAVSATVVADTQPPSVTVTAPAGGATVSGTVQLTADASDDVGVVGVQFRVDGVAVGAEDTTAPYSASWTSTGVPNGSHRITAVARDAAGRTNVSAPVDVTVANAGPSGLVAGWSFNEGSGTTAADGSGNGRTGTVNGATWTAAGRLGGALSFDGVNDWVTVADAASLDLTTAMTVSAWVRPTALGAWRTVVMKERPGGLAYALYASGDSVTRPNGYLTISEIDRSVFAPSALATNTWTHLAFTYDGATMRLFVNGAEVASRAQTGAAATSASPLRIGGNSVWSSEWFAGQIDEVRIYNRALTGAEVSTIRDLPLP